jgi:hypothetical protein
MALLALRVLRETKEMLVFKVLRETKEMLVQ